MIEYRRYRDDEEVAVGDVVASTGMADAAFGTAIVVKIDDVQIYLERPHMKVTSCASGAILVERYGVSRSNYKANLHVYVTGRSGNVDNRLR